MNMTQKLAWIFGIVFIIIGIGGFIPGITTADGLLLGIFQVDGLHNIIHLLSGILAIGAAWGTGMYARLYFQVFGVVYALVTIVGFLQGDTVLGLITVNMADNLLHVVISVVALYVGFAMKGSSSGSTMSAAV